MEIDKQATNRNRPKIGVVLSSGSFKALASVALFEFLDEEEIDFDLLVGCSGGAILVGLRGAGYDNQQIVEVAREFAKQKALSNIDVKTLLGIAKLPFGRFDITKGLLKREPSMEFCRRTFKDRRIEDLRPTTILHATDIQTGEGVALRNGFLAEAIYASSAFFPMLPPICIEGRWLVDGAYSSPLPVIEAVNCDADVIIAMLFHEKLNPEPKHFMDGFHNVVRAFSTSLVKSQLSISIDLHHHEIIVINVPFEKPIPMSDAGLIPAIIDAGHRAVDLKKEEIIEAITSF